MLRFLRFAFLLLLAIPALGQVPPFPADFVTRELTTNGATIHVRVGGAGPAVVLLHGYGETGDMWAPRLSMREALATEAEHFAACINGGAVPMTDGLAGLRVVETLEAASESMRRRGYPIDLHPMRKAS